MDELELLKKDWKKTQGEYPKVTSDQLYNMIAKKSSSIVKWIFIISILEFVLWTALSFILKDTDYNQRFKEYGADNIMVPFMAIGYAILLYFFYKFFMNYKRISVVDNAKKLMENILNTRKTVKHYVAFNLVYMAISFFVVLGIQLDKDQKMIAVKEQAAASGELLVFYGSMFGIVILMIVVITLLILGFYYLIYGLLLGRLNTNYKELKKMEM